MLFKNIVKNLSNNIYDKDVYCKLIDDYINYLKCKGSCCDNYSETRKTINFLVKESAQKKQIETMNKEFWMSIFHDIKNPMIGIDFALRNAASVAQKGRILKDVHSLNQANLEFIRTILENYRFEEGFFEKKHENINLKKFLHRLTRGYKYILKERQVKINLNEVGEDIVLRSCPISISRIFSNLITNAAKFARKGSEITIECEILKGKNYWTLVSIKNYGEKIANLRGIFEKFISNTGSSGLGLHICKKTVKEVGGRIWAENFDDGVRFCILLKV